MTFHEFVAGIVEVSLLEVDSPEEVVTIEIEHTYHYSKESRAWNVILNRASRDMPYSKRFIDRITEQRTDANSAALKVSRQKELHMTILYSDGQFVIDDL